MAAIELEQPSSLVTVQEMADRLGISATTTRAWLRSGKIPCFRSGDERGSYRVPRGTFEAWLAGQAPQETTTAPLEAILDALLSGQVEVVITLRPRK